MARDSGVDAKRETRTDDDSGEPSKDGPDIAIRVVRDRLERRRCERRMHVAVMLLARGPRISPGRGALR